MYIHCFQMRILCLVITLWMAALTAQAQSLVSGNGIQIESKEIQDDIERAPPEVKAEMSKGAALKTTVSNMYVRRVLAKEASNNPVAKNPLVIAAIEKAKERILSDAMLETIDQKNQPSLAAIEAYARSMYNANQKKYGTPEQVRASHILIRSGEQGAKGKIEEIHKLLLSERADFESIAKTRSQDPGSAAKGGDLGYFGRGRMIEPFEKVVFAMNRLGELGEVFESPFGYHIIKLTDKKPAGVMLFAEVKDQLMKEAQNEILMQGRLKEQERILKEAQFNDQALEALEKSLNAKP